MSDQPEDQEPIQAEIVATHYEDTGYTQKSNYAYWLDATNEQSGIRAESWENQVDVCCNILFGTGQHGDGDDREPWQEASGGPVLEMRDRVRLAAGEKLIRLFDAEFDPAPPITYDPPPYFAAVSQDDEDQD